jgi:hypothetical protein
MTGPIVRALVFSCAVFVAACTTKSGGTSTDTGTNPSQSADGTYQLKTVRGTNLPVSLFGQCSLGSPQPCAACSESAASGTLTLKSNPTSFEISLVANGTCVDPLGRSPTTTSTYTSGTGGSWSISGGTITFGSNQMNLSTGTLSGSTISASFNWINPDPGGQPLSVSATFTK